MRRMCWLANLLLAGFAVLALIQSTGTVSGGGTAVRVLYLRSQGILDLEKACDVNPEWCDSEKLGRFVAAQHTGGEFLLALIAIVVAILNLSELAKPTERRDPVGPAPTNPNGGKASH